MGLDMVSLLIGQNKLKQDCLLFALNINFLWRDLPNAQKSDFHSFLKSFVKN